MNEITRESLWGLSHYTYGEAYFGSCAGMRYRLAREPLSIPKDQKDNITPLLKASVWPEPFAYAKTPPEQITEETFPFSEEGMQAACRYFNDHLQKKDFQSPHGIL